MAQKNEGAFWSSILPPHHGPKSLAAKSEVITPIPTWPLSEPITSLHKNLQIPPVALGIKTKTLALHGLAPLYPTWNHLLPHLCS